MSGNRQDNVLFAVWFSGIIYLKQLPNAGETFCDCSFLCERYKMLRFSNGMLINVKDERSMEEYVDSIEIYNHPKKYDINQYYGISRISPCTINLMEKESLTENYRILLDFHAYTNDELTWNNTAFLIGESPLSVLDDFKNIYPNVLLFEINDEIPRFHEKNYMAKWIIVNDELYLSDIEFQPGNEYYEEIYNREYPIRLQAIEKFLGMKFQQIKSLQLKVIFAEWFSGTLFMKRYAEKDEKYFHCSYECEPFYRLLIEKGKIKSKEKTNYMFSKRTD